MNFCKLKESIGMMKSEKSGIEKNKLLEDGKKGINSKRIIII